eukprot:30446-Pelagococcus_subviridis.AAC.2
MEWPEGRREPGLDRGRDEGGDAAVPRRARRRSRGAFIFITPVPVRPRRRGERRSLRTDFFSRRISPPTSPRFQYPPSAPFNSAEELGDGGDIVVEPGPDDSARGRRTIRVPPGTGLWMSPYVYGRLPKCWGEDSDEAVARYRPERWAAMRENGESAPDAYMPFGGGPRVCLGSRFATLEGKARAISHWSPYDRVRVVNADP